jgi:hypothetical protein
MTKLAVKLFALFKCFHKIHIIVVYTEPSEIAMVEKRLCLFTGGKRA